MKHIGMLHIIRQANAYNIVRSVPVATQKTPRKDKNAANISRTAAVFSRMELFAYSAYLNK
jgi:hypothetical protein